MMKRFLPYFTCILLCFLPLWLLAQHSSNSKAIRLYDKALQLYKQREYLPTMKQLDEVLKADSLFAEAYLLKGDLFSDLKQPEKAIKEYNNALAIDTAVFPPAYYIIANLQFGMEQYAEARKNYFKYLAFHPKNQVELEKVSRNLPLCEFRMKLMANPVSFNPVNLGEAVNSFGYEYINSVSVDEEQMYFTRRGADRRDNESFFESHKENGQWCPATELGEPINTSGNEGALCLSPDRMSFYLTCCSRFDSYGSCDLYTSQRYGNQWTEPMNLGKTVNSTAWDSQPCLASDGRTLYFVSSRKGTKGGSDIFCTVKQADGTWSQPVNLGDSINTPADEMAPFIHADGRTLYFSSEGHPGMGGADLFVSRMDINGNWTKAVNIGYPVNTKGDEINLVINAGGDAAYISSDKEGGFGNVDIYRFELPKEARPQPVSYVEGRVFDKKDRHPLGASFELIDLATSQIIVRSTSDAATGEFLLCLPVDHDFALNVTCQGYLFYSKNFSLSDKSGKESPKQLDIPMQPVSIGETVILHNIFFETDKFELKPESKAELDKLVEFMLNNTSMTIEISGHTDNTGAEQHNLDLSEQRALAVYNYLVANGIAKERLSYKGYGKSKPIDINDTPEGRANNRRTEFSVVSM
ncbi:MAG TPA: OmpA family protein [Bacteroidales bacterium]|nr:OmpA family protein [Bacteroidales bacterium]HPT02113.1 OmpA family protein [Bacteroidales bacterium]